MGLAHASMPMQCFVHVKVNLEKKKQVLPIAKLLFFILARNKIMLQHPFYLFFASKVVAVTYERWSLTRGSK